MRETRPARRTLTVTAAALLVVTGCRGDDGAPAATVPVTVGIDGLPVPHSAPDASPATASPVSAEPSFTPGALVPALGDRPWLLVGTGRPAPGEPSRLTLLTSPDGTSWAPLDIDTGEHSSGTAAVGRADGTALVAGSVDGADGLHPALWTFSAGALSAPDVLADLTGRVTAIAVDDAGEPALLLATGSGPAVATRPDGSWLVTPLPGGGDAVGIGISATTTVVTGSTVWRSGDDGATFEASSAPPVLGAVLGTPGGFLAASCATGSVALSPDGRTWTDLVAVHPRGAAPVPGQGCGAIALDDEGGVWLTTTTTEPVVFRVRDQVVDRLGVPTRPPGTIFDGDPLVAVAGGTVVAAVPQPGGVATSMARSVALTSGLELDVAMPATTGALPGHPVPVAVTPLDDRGRIAGVSTYPYVTDEPDGSYRWTTAIAASAIDASGHLVPDETAAPIGPDGQFGGIVTTGRGSVSLATVVDAEVPPGYSGPLGDVVVSRRAPSSGGWRARELVAGGLGRQAVNAVARAGEMVVGVGEQVTVDAAGVAVAVPLVLAGDGRTFEALDVPAGPAAFFAACPGPGGTVMAVGADAAGASVVAAIDPAAGTVDVLPAPPGPPLQACAGDGDHVLMTSGRDLFGSEDGTAFDAVGGLEPGDTVTAVAAGPAGFAAAGTTVTGDGFVLHGPSPAELSRLDTALLGGPGEHEPTGVAVRAEDLVVLGLADGAPTSWRVPLR